MQNLGKIVLLTILFLNTLHATVTARVEPRDIFAGDTVNYVLTITGSNVKKPVLSDICGNNITATGSQTSIQSYNGSYKKSYNLSYQFTPQKSCHINAVSVEIDAQMQESNSVELKILPRVQDLHADFTLEFKGAKKELYVGEPFTLTLLLKQKRGAQVVDSKFIAPEFKGFWKKSEQKPVRTQDNEYLTTKVVYELAAQREGNLSIEPAALRIATRSGSNNWGTLIPQVKWRTYYSNAIKMQVKALPQGAKLIGDFSISAAVTHRTVNPNEAVNLVLKVQGEGNLEDIESFKPYIDNVNVFDEKIVIHTNTLSQKLVFVSDTDFTIPSFELTYFDRKLQEVKTVKTAPIAIKVRGAVSNKKVQITRATPIPTTSISPKTVSAAATNNYVYLGVVFIFGLILGLLSMFFFTRKGRRQGVKKVQKLDIKDEKKLLVKLLPYKDIDKEVFKIVTILETNIYSTNKEVIDKKLLKEIIRKYDIS